MILQRIPRTDRVQVAISKTEQEVLGWKPGDKVTITADRESDSITIKRYSKEEKQ